MERTNLITELAQVLAAIRLPHTVRVAIDGIDAAGKTILANELVEPLRNLGRPVIRASIDGFHNPAAVRYRRGPDSPEGYYHDSFDYDTLKAHLLLPLGPDGDGRYKRVHFDFRSDSEVACAFEVAPAGAILLFDGVFLLRPELQDSWDWAMFMDIDFEISVARAMERDQHLFGEAQNIRERYLKRYVPGQKLYLTEGDPIRIANVIIYNNDPANADLEEMVL